MALSGAEQAAVASVFEEMEPKYQEIGGEAMDSLFKDHPDTKSHFSHMDVTPGSQDLRTHGGKIMDALHHAVKDYGKLHEGLAKLREEYTTELKLNVETIKMLTSSLVPVIVRHYPTADSAVLDKFLNEFADNLIGA